MFSQAPLFCSQGIVGNKCFHVKGFFSIIQPAYPNAFFKNKMSATYSVVQDSVVSKS